MHHKVEIDFHGRPLSIEVGRMAKQASGSALVQYGETVVLTTAVASQSTRPGIDFFPLTVDYQEKASPPARFRAASSSARAGRARRKFSPRA